MSELARRSPAAPARRPLDVAGGGTDLVAAPSPAPGRDVDLAGLVDITCTKCRRVVSVPPEALRSWPCPMCIRCAECRQLCGDEDLVRHGIDPDGVR